MTSPETVPPLPVSAQDFSNGTLAVEALFEGNNTRYCCVAANERGAAYACTDITILGKQHARTKITPS